MKTLKHSIIYSAVLE